jgi:hypothetical protein
MNSSSIELPPEHRRLNHYWRLLASLMDELADALDVGDLSPEERLARVRELRQFVHARMGPVPRSVVAEDAARRAEAGEPSLDTVLADFDRQLAEDGRATVYVMGEDGELHEDVYVPHTGRYLAIIDNDWSSDSPLSETAMAWLHAEVTRRRDALPAAERHVRMERLTASGIIAELIEEMARTNG